MTPTVEITAPPRRRLLLWVMCVGMFLVQLDVTVVNVALPRIGAELAPDLSAQQWVVDAYAVVLAGLLLAGGAVGDRYGHRRVVLAGLGVFAAASLACGLAPDIAVLVGGRAAQGLGAAMLLPSTLAVITRAFPDRAEQARAVGVWAGTSALALPAGPLIGGALVSTLGWRSAFLVNLPVIAVALPLAYGVVAESADRGVRSLDLPGAALATAGLAAPVYAVIEAGAAGMTTSAWGALAISALAVTGFLLRESRAPQPLLPLRLLRSRRFSGANLVAAAMNLVGIGTVFVTTLYLQGVQHRNAATAGAMLLPLFVPMAALAPVTGRLTGRFGPRPPMTAGLVIGAAGAASLVGITPDSGYARLLPALLGLGTGMGLLTAAVVAAAVRAVPADRAGLAGGVNNTARQTAGALAVAVFGGITGGPADAVRFTGGLHLLGLLSCALWISALALTWFAIPAEKAW
ncbi:DHA2 family methylenomycin A resistance protein-like MFS transporter [Saccharopolyspora erythraea NRRL 2338]|uniref:Drug resistance transporter, EmrB/QacA family n=2 Tax=Saccharopolyspora erythraea TaxID=1836 RepID=A4F5W3_SACEN|nr:MFS transporter [Saccharopolyspora erythraea]EQD84215.1 major facilitator transporter [Saccharopolyspora erythraea D]PFG93236.1 DHA2 family methylenomycin A resistance protein-like MFS transporter [Saccharopolyspora erythraea NRRL 2338]QRK90089.1 MFS transporter [Saccharopolyspora erythraea]CAL99437.1 drug resistance transporter, EmrB/QacA family [Saccharopolyspora erythraea NRRL 2338]